MPDIPVWPDDQPRSKDWQVHIDGQPVPVISCDRGDFALWTTENPCTIEIIASKAVAEGRLRPRRAAITPEISGDRLCCRFPGPMRALIEEPGLPLLHLFAEPPPAPAPVGARVIAAGTRLKQQFYTLADGEALWIERGAVLHAHLLAHGHDIRIGGGGMVSGKGLARNRHLVADGCPGLSISDLTVVDPEGWSVVLGACDDAVLTDLRILSPGAGSGTDGIDLVGCRRSRISRCYIISGDDAIAIKAFSSEHASTDWARSVEDIQVDHCILGCFGGHCMEIGHELRVPRIDNIRFQDIDVLFAHGFGAPFGIHAGDRASVRGIHWNNVSIEHCYHQLMDLRVMRSRYNHDADRGHIDDVSFTDIDWWRTIYNAGYTIGVIGGFDSTHRVRGIRFERFRRDGMIAQSADDLDILMRHVDQVEFVG